MIKREFLIFFKNLFLIIMISNIFLKKLIKNNKMDLISFKKIFLID